MNAFLTIPPAARPRRVIFIGDIHGCYDELVELLGKLRPSADDVVISVGDIVRKGPHAIRCLRLWQERGYHAVLGNNEARVLEHSSFPANFFTRADVREIAIRPQLVRYLRTWPIAIDVPEQNVSAVHGYDLVRMRYLRRAGEAWKRVSKGKEQPGDVQWAEVWSGPRMVVYGHTPVREATFTKHALGIDTGCVYGGKLTAAVFSGDTTELVSVSARRKYD
jgi:predicted phosphodiesterase